MLLGHTEALIHGLARQCEVVFDRRSAVLFADDVIDLAAVKSVLVGDQALFAMSICESRDQTA